MKENYYLTYLGILTLFVQMFKMFYGFSVLAQGWFFSVIWVVFYMILFPKDVLQKRLIPFFLFYLIAILHRLMGSTFQRLNTFSDMVYLFSYYFYPFLYFYYLINHTGVKSKKISLAVLSVIIVFYALQTIGITGGDTYFIRRSVTDMDQINAYRFLGLADYSLTHAIVFMVPVFVFMMKSSVRIVGKVIGLLLLSASYILVYLGGATTPMLLFFLSVVTSFILNSKRSNAYNMAVLIISVLFIIPILNQTNLLSFLSSIESVLPSDSPYIKRIVDLEESLIYESAEGDVGARLVLYANSWDTFFSHPLFGTLNGELIGGHAYFADMLAALGLFGSVFLFYYLYEVIKYTYRVVPVRLKVFYLSGILLFFIMGFVKNLSGNDYFIIPFIYLPLLCMVLDNNKIEVNLMQDKQH